MPNIYDRKQQQGDNLLVPVTVAVDHLLWLQYVCLLVVC